MPKDRVLGTDGAHSQMAAASLREHATDRFEPCCVALTPRPVDQRTMRALRQHGIDGASVWLYPLAAVRGQFRYVIALDETVELPHWLADGSLSWTMPDPLADDTMAAFEQARELIEGTLFDWLTKFEEQFEPEPNVPRHYLASAAAHKPV